MCNMDQLECNKIAANIKQENTDDLVTNIKEEPSSSTDMVYKGECEYMPIGALINEEIDIKPDISSSDDETDLTTPPRSPKANDKRKKVMRSQAREIIALVYQHMKKESLQGVEKVKDARWRTAQATGVSEKTVTRILKEKRESDATGEPMRSPHRNKKPRKCLRREMEKKDKDFIRKIITNYQKEHNKPPTLHCLKKVLKEKMDFNGCIETLRRLLGQIGYEFKATRTNSVRNKILVEKK